jgi:hypothetical protein
MRGRPLKEIQEILGHKSFSMQYDAALRALESEAPADGGGVA